VEGPVGGVRLVEVVRRVVGEVGVVEDLDWASRREIDGGVPLSVDTQKEGSKQKHGQLHGKAGTLKLNIYFPA
jgi:hypothetical protein